MNEINYAFWLIILVFVALPLYLVGISIAIEDGALRKRFFLWGGVIGCACFSFLIFKQMNIEVIYGKELLDYWYATNK